MERRVGIEPDLIGLEGRGSHQTTSDANGAESRDRTAFFRSSNGREDHLHQLGNGSGRSNRTVNCSGMNRIGHPRLPAKFFSPTVDPTAINRLRRGRSDHRAAGPNWSGRGESNPYCETGDLASYH